MSWQDYVKAATDLGFQKVTIINRTNYQTVGYTSAQDIAQAWKDGDKDINENQELLDDWLDQKKISFCFYRTKYNIVLRDDNDGGQFICCMAGKSVLVAKQFKTIWFIASGTSKTQGSKDKDQKGGFVNAPAALNKICKEICDALDESGI